MPFGGNAYECLYFQGLFFVRLSGGKLKGFCPRLDSGTRKGNVSTFLLDPLSPRPVLTRPGADSTKPDPWLDFASTCRSTSTCWPASVHSRLAHGMIEVVVNLSTQATVAHVLYWIHELGAAL